MKPLTITTHSAKETQEIARLLAREILDTNTRPVRNQRGVHKLPHERVSGGNPYHNGQSDFISNGIKWNGVLVIALEGDLGSGKTTFSQGFAKGLGIKEKVLSPTFVLLKNYPLQTTHYKLFVHMDAYRLKSAKELQVLGWRDILKDTEAIVLVEWADRVRRALPKEYIRILFEFVDEKTRNIIISNF